VTRLRCGDRAYIFSDHITAYFLENVSVKQVDQYLVKTWTIVCCLLFSDSMVNFSKLSMYIVSQKRETLHSCPYLC